MTDGSGVHSPSSSTFESTLFLGVFHGLGRAILCNVGSFLAATIKRTGEDTEDVEVQSGLWREK